MPRIVRRIALSLPSLIGAGLIVVYLLFAWLGFEPLARWLAPKIVAERSAHVLTIERARFNPFLLTVRLGGVKLADPDGKPLLAFGELLLDFQVASAFTRTYTFKEVRLTEPDVRVDVDPQGRLNWMRLVDAFAGPPHAEPPKEEGGLTRFLIQHAVLQKGRVGIEDRRAGGGFRTVVEPLDIEVHDLSTLPADKGDHVLSLRTSFGAQVRWKGELGLNPLEARGDVVVDDVQLARVWPLLRSPLRIAPPEGRADLTLSYRVGHDQGRLAVQVDKLALQLQGLALRGADEREAALALDRIDVRGGRIDLLERTAAFDAVQVDGGRVALQRAADGRLSVEQWAPPAAGAEPAAAPASAGDKPWRVALGKVTVDGVACRYVDHAFAAPLSADVGRVQVGLRVDGEFGTAAPKVLVDGLEVALQSVRVASAAQKAPLLELDAASLRGGQFDLAQQRIALGTVALNGAKTALTRDAHGELSLLAALRTTPSAASSPAAASAGAAAPWHYRVDAVQLDGMQLALRDESVQPPLTLTLQQIQAEAQAIGDDAGAAMPVRLKLQVREGGRLDVQGRVARAGPMADLRVKLDDLALQPAQPLIAQFATLTLAGGRASTAGRVRVQGARVRYDGAFEVKNLLLNETPSGERFIAWSSLGTNRLMASTERLQIDELRVAGLDAKLQIAKDRTINIAKVVKPRADAAAKPPAAPAADAKATAPATDAKATAPATDAKATAPATDAKATAPAPNTKATAPAADAKAAAYGVTIGRVRVIDGDLDFADLSLALPFAARIHGLQGQLVGLSNQPGAAAQLELQGQVDEYGLSRAVGQINLFDPTAFTDIRVVFQNVEMTRLTPYSATFAGRKIASGKLSLDLQYKVKARQLQGDNQIVMDELTLGERVESPTAVNLPLDLALAILQDENGRIDLGLPVSGSLDDPQFSYGGIIWKAIVNVLTKIVTAPFRALGALFGSGDEQTAKVVFDVGEAALLPPEREKIHKLAQALAKRPRLSIAVQAAYDPAADRAALKAASLRRAVAAQMGRELPADAEAGPISTADPNARAAIEALYAKRFGAPALQQIQAKFAQANPAPPPTDAAGRLVSRLGSLFKETPPPLSAQEAEQLKGADLHARLLERLLDAEPASDEQLAALGTSRAQAVRGELVAAGVAGDRIQLDAPSARDHSATLSLAVMRPAPAASSAAAAAPRAVAGIAR